MYRNSFIVHWHAELKIVQFQFNKILCFLRSNAPLGIKISKPSRHKVVGTESTNSAIGSLSVMVREGKPSSTSWFLEHLLLDPCIGSELLTRATWFICLLCKQWVGQREAGWHSWISCGYSYIFRVTPERDCIVTVIHFYRTPIWHCNCLWSRLRFKTFPSPSVGYR